MLLTTLGLVTITCLILYLRRRLSRQYVLAERIGGPKGCPVLGHTHLFLRKEFLAAMTELDALYSGIARFWFGYKLVVGINDPDLYEEVLNNKSALDKGEFYHFMRPLFGDGLIAADSNIWKRNRKIVAPTLNAVKVKSFTSVFVEGSEKLTDIWIRKVGLPFEPYTDVSKTAFGFTMKTALGKNGEWPDSKLEEMVQLVNRISAGVAHRFIRPWLYPEWIFRLTPTGEQVYSDTVAFRRFLRDMIALKTELSEAESMEDNGFVSHILDVSRKNAEFPSSAVVDELSTYMTAGFETTSTAITFTLVMLGCHPILQEKAYYEQLNILEDKGQEVDWDSLCAMEYLERIIKETMRLFPVITVIGRQISAELTVGKKKVPVGAFAVIPIYAVHRNPGIWYEPHIFDPDRFLSHSEKDRHHQAFLPFGGGPRICMGQKYALASMKALLSSVIRRFKITTNYEMEDIKLSKSVTLNTRGLTITLNSRK